jgi:hypothetical protein
VPRHEQRGRKAKKISSLTNTAEKDKTEEETLETEINNYGKVDETQEESEGR